MVVGQKYETVYSRKEYLWNASLLIYYWKNVVKNTPFFHVIITHLMIFNCIKSIDAI